MQGYSAATSSVKAAYACTLAAVDRTRGESRDVTVLVLDAATTIFDSRVIVECLDNASPVTKLLSEDTVLQLT